MGNDHKRPIGVLRPINKILADHFAKNAAKNTEEMIMQPNGMRESLRPENRVIAEAFYQSKGVGVGVPERLSLFITDKDLIWFYEFFQTHRGDQDYLAWLEWGRWQWDRVMD